MKDKIITVIIFTAFIIGTICLFKSCEYKETQEYEIVSARVWEDIEERGVFTTKKEVTTYIEIIYKTEDNYEKINVYPNSIFIEPETKVVHKKGRLSPMVYMTTDYYETLFK